MGKIFFTILISGLFVFTAGAVFAQSSAAPENKFPPDSVSGNRVSETKNNSTVQKGGSEKIFVEAVLSEATQLNEGTLGDNILLKINNIQDFLNDSKNKGKPIVLFINGLPIRNVTSRNIIDTSANKGWIKFPLKMKGAEEEWLEILRRPQIASESSNFVTVSTGIDGERELESAKNNFSLVIYSSTAFFQFIAVSILLLLITVYLAVKTDMLREPVIDNNSSVKRPYSLALTQMAFWSYLVISSYLALYIITKEFPSITNSVLALMGISSATALGSVMINYKKVTDAKQKIISMNAEMRSIDDRVKVISESAKDEKTPARKEELREEMELLNKRQYEIRDTIKSDRSFQSFTGKGFINDLLSDSGGVSLYRFQIAVWTIVLGYIFIFTVWNSIKMPEFDNTLLALMGISSGTYLGFKIPEQRQ
ncbi:MAG: hypothetical protein JSS91_05520 [Bacteroidetes bacterium]|nr:hypothetical protein [Bacteroidota bacterium]